MVIRPEQPGEEQAIAEVVATAFGSPVEADLVRDLRASPGFVPSLALVAVLADQVVGHVMVTGATLQDGEVERSVAMLSPLAVAPAHQGAGIGSALVREVTARADELGEPIVVLEGSPAFYGRLGFEHSAPLGIHLDLPSWAPPEAAQVLRLRAYDRSTRGEVRYPAAFDALPHD